MCWCVDVLWRCVVLMLVWVWPADKDIDYYNYISLLCREFNLQLDEELLIKLLSFIDVTMESMQETTGDPNGHKLSAPTLPGTEPNQTKPIQSNPIQSTLTNLLLLCYCFCIVLPCSVLFCSILFSVGRHSFILLFLVCWQWCDGSGSRARRQSDSVQRIVPLEPNSSEFDFHWPRAGPSRHRQWPRGHTPHFHRLHAPRHPRETRALRRQCAYRP